MLLTAKEVAQKLGISHARVIQLIGEGLLKSTKDKFSKRVHQIDETDLENFHLPKRGRPKKIKRQAQ